MLFTCHRCPAMIPWMGTCPACMAIVQITEDTPRERRVWFKIEPADEIARRIMLTHGCVYEPEFQLWSAAPPATPLREVVGCVPSPYGSHSVHPVDRGGMVRVSDLVPGVLQ
jgi:hypothetical protein